MRSTIESCCRFLFACTIALSLFSTPAHALTLRLDTVSGTSSLQALVTLRADSFTNLITVQGTLQFNPAVASFANVEAFGLPGMTQAVNFNVANAGTGVISFTWDDGSLLGVTLANGATLFQIRFNLTGTAGQQTAVTFISSPTPPLFSDIDFNEFAPTTNNGLIQISGAALPPANDSCNAATELVCGDTLEGTTIEATLDAIGSCNSVLVENPGVWYTFPGTGTTLTVTLSCVTPGFDSRINVYQGDCVGGFDCIGANEHFCGLPVDVTFDSDEGTTYYALVHNASGTSGEFQISLSCAYAENDTCGGALEVLCGQTISGSTTDATPEFVPTCDDDASAPGVWYAFTGTGDFITVSTCSGNTNYDTRITVYEGDCDNLVCVTENDDDFVCGINEQSTAAFQSSIGTPYFFYVHGFSDAEGDFELSIICETLTGICAFPDVLISDTLPPVEDSIELTGETGVITDLNVSFNITHPYIGDLSILITSPSGTSVVLYIENCGFDPDIIATFDDEGLDNFNGCNLSGNVAIIPAELLAAFDGEDPNGFWKVIVTDNFPSDDGTLVSWCLQFSTGDCAFDAACNDNDACTLDECVTGTCVNTPLTTQCIAPDNGGTADFPTQCPYHGNIEITDGFAAGDSLLSQIIFNNFQNLMINPGGNLGGDSTTVEAEMVMLQLTGTGSFSGYQRTLTIPIPMFEVHTAPRTPGLPYQVFETDLFRLFGQIDNDTDFDLLRITAGTDFGLLSPGQTVLNKQGNDWEVSSFFDVTYRIDFVGNPTGPFAGLSGSTTATFRMSLDEPFCTDNNLCTNDYCDNGVCASQALNCDDGVACTQDQCFNGFCQNAQIECADLDACTNDTCIGGFCPFPLINCDDSDNCTTDTCIAGVCDFIAITCDTSDLCLQGFCNNGVCEYFSDDCDDGDACTEDICLGSGFCDYAPIVCDDANVCNGLETCDIITGCIAGTPLPCNDNDACNGVETCIPALGCAVGTVLNCDDSDTCTIDNCDELLGCVYTANPNCNDPCDLLICDDNDACNGLETCDQILGCINGTPPTCNDNDACNGVETCNAITGCVAGTPPTCNDNDACNGVETCNAISGCEAGTPLTCNDNDACNGVETCNAISGCEAGTPLTCNDNDACTGIETCIPALGCVVGTTLDCNDNSACTTDGCEPLSGCSNILIDCDDNNLCTTEGCDPLSGCSNILIDCDDNSVCTTDGCQPLSGCSNILIDCDDNNLCTTDSCDSITGCSNILIDCDDNSVCTTDGCQPLSGCSNILIDCDDSDACTFDSCNSATGCFSTPKLCDDNDPCNGLETCEAGTGNCLQGTPITCGLVLYLDTVSGASTTEVLVTMRAKYFTDLITVKGSLQFDPLVASFMNVEAFGLPGMSQAVNFNVANAASGVISFTWDDGTLLGVSLANGDSLFKIRFNLVGNAGEETPVTFINTPTPPLYSDVAFNEFAPTTNNGLIQIEQAGCLTNTECDDFSACTIDSCNLGTCTNELVNCDDSDACTTDDCNPASGCFYLPLNCDDADECTTEICNTITGCEYTPVVCDDSDACTIDDCDPSSGCSNLPTNCDDADACTDDGCDIVSGCFPTTTVCDDNSVCTGIETCNPAIGCVAGTPLVCDDLDTCTIDACDALLGCIIIGTNPNCVDPCDALTCADSDLCTIDTCISGACSFPDKDCSDTDPCTIDKCDAGTCDYASVVCPDDGLVCTDEICDPLLACISDTLDCDDNNLCTIDYCGPLVRECSHDPVVCVQDADLCMDEICDPAQGCISVPKDCSDGDLCTDDICQDNNCFSTPKVCTPDDACHLAECLGGGCVQTPIPNCCLTVFDCTDSNPCTIDKCLAFECAYLTISGCCQLDSECADADLCTDDLCVTNVCEHNATNCDDGDPCTLDSCDSAIGCSHDPNDGGACNDGNPCTENDTCTGGICSGILINCDDGNDCTLDECIGGICSNTPSTSTPGCCAAFIDCNDADLCTIDKCISFQCANITIQCDDNSACTDDICQSGNCIYQYLCDDLDFCTDDFCDSLTGCSHVEKICDDLNECTDDFCNPATGCIIQPKDCNDLNVCTLDSCDTGTGCFYTDVVCNDSSVCTTDVCDEPIGCAYTPIVCDDNSLCTTNSCDSLTGCFYTAIPPCDDGNPCTDESCNPATGCVFTNDDTNVCSDGSLCTDNDVCSAGTCAGNTIACNDNNPCTDNSCDPATGCVFTNDNTNVCSDGSLCTDNDVCSAGTCAGSSVTCNDNNACTDDSCDPATGCVFTNDNTNVCSDGSLCTDNDVCSAGTCAGSSITCNDNNACTDDSCDPATGCVFTNDNTNVCNDGSLCTDNDVCSAGTCAGNTITCNDNNPCTDDSCDPATGCVFTNDNTNVCSDGSICTDNDVCAAGTCAGTVITCNDNDVCTDDSCDPLVGCVYTNNNATCDDADACTDSDVCASGTCAGTPITCNDNNGCTDDSCNPLSGCVFVNNISACSDNDACTENDVCFGGSCQSGTPLDCDDADFCTIDDCDVLIGCLYTEVICNDGDACTDDFCNPAFGCFTQTTDCNDINACTDDFCNSATGCFYTDVICDDGDLCTTDSCSTFSGCIFSPVVCDDGDLCTTDKCENGVCVYEPIPCNDANVCTTDSCVAGICEFTPISCDDGNPCIIDLCDPITGCYYEPVNCDDSDFCTTDFCDAIGTCQHPAVDCDDASVCTLDSCNTASGCFYTDIVCEDFNACTENLCDAATDCFYPAVNCDDSDFCTEDFCDIITGCYYITVDCNDFNACTNEICAPASGCIYTDVDCNDNNECTVDDCNPASGCVYTPAVCDDFNACTVDNCDAATGCFVVDLDCNDNNACTTDDCDIAFGCVYTNVICDDFSFCTTEFCDPTSGCIFTDVLCDDLNICTTDNCNPTVGCEYTPIDCNDGSACTSELCDPAIGCVYTNVDCNDFNACTTDSCHPILGCGYAPVDCNDNDACTVDNCDSFFGCVYTTTVCNDLDACTNDFCDVATGCFYSDVDCNDNNECTLDACEPVFGCFYTFVNCDDLNACTSEFCDAIAGCVYTDVNCDDFSACTIDDCEPATGCTYVPVDCNDFNACTTEFCDAFFGCVYTSVDCEDFNQCTIDACDPAVGCVYTDVICDDFDPCTNDFCDPGIGCVFPPIVCDDGDFCTTDKCEFGLCVYLPIPCVDGDLCTEDICVSGICDFIPLVCDDADTCTIDECDPLIGCIHTPTIGCPFPCSNVDCDDGDFCTTDWCDVGICEHACAGNFAHELMWQKALGGNSGDGARSVHQTADGGYIVAGYAWSNNGDVSGNNGQSDFWVVKLDGAGNLVWQNALGGDKTETAYSVKQTADGGYILAGSAASNSNGDVSANNGQTDFWVVKLDVNGNLVWEELYGGNKSDVANAVVQTADGGYAVAGWTSSNNSGDVSGNHGGSDFWVIKLDAAGILLWQKALGGTKGDLGNAIQQTADGGYVVAGSTASNNGNVSGNNGSNDFWIVKLDASGNILWQNALGGSASDKASSVQQTADGGYIAAGVTKSNDGDVSGNNGNEDYWIVKLDAAGNLSWQQTYGGSKEDIARSIVQTNDGGYFISGSALSNNGDVSASKGGRDFWVVKTDGAGAIEWEKSLGGNADDFAFSSQQTTDEGYIIAGHSNSKNNGDVTGHKGVSDFWVVKLNADRTCAPTTTLDVALCEGESINIGGEDVSSSGTYFDTLTKANGCDSIVIYNITIPNCDDSDLCTIDACANGLCSYSTVVCEDGDLCTIDACGAGGCTFTAINCNDNDGCTVDVCVDGICSNNPIAGCNCDNFTVTFEEQQLPVWCQGATVTLKALPANAAAYLWSTGENTASIVVAPGTYSVTVTALNGCFGTSTYSTTPPDQLLSSYVIVAKKRATVSMNTVFSGGIGVLDVTNKAEIKNGSVVTAAGTFVKADVIQISGGSSVSVQDPNPATLTLPAFEYNPDCSGGTSVTVPNNGNVTLNGSVYKGVVIGKNATVTFTQSDINLENIYTQENATIKFAANCVKLRICKKLQLGINNSFNPDAKDVVAFVELDVTVGASSDVTADIYMDAGKMTIEVSPAGDPTVMKGLFIVNWLEGKDNAHWYQNTDCPGECYPQEPILCVREVTSFTLVSADTDADLGTLVDGAVIDLSITGPINIRANVCLEQNIESLLFQLNGNDYKTENIPFYTIAGDNNGNYLPWNIQPGVYTIRAIPYSGNGAGGIPGIFHEITITIVGCGAGERKVTSFTLIDATTDTDIGELVNGAVIDLSITGPINVRANVCAEANVESVRFLQNGNQFRIESEAPYAYYGDNSGNYHNWRPQPGVYTIKAIPYSDNNGVGTAGTDLSVTFTVIGSAAKMDGAEHLSIVTDEATQLSAYPNPFTDRLNIEFTLAEDSRVKLEIFNLEGKRITELFEGNVKAGELQKYEFTPDKLADGMILYRLQTKSGAYFGKAVLTK